MDDVDTGVVGCARNNLLKCLVSLSVYACSCYYFGALGVIVVTIVGLFLNTSSSPRDENQLSAYGILNPEFRRILGDLRLEQLERQLFNRYVESDDEREPDRQSSSLREKYSDDEMNYPISKFSNKKCPRCNSGKKYKKCCALLLKS